MADVRCDVLVVGGSLGGVAAALRAGEMGASVVLVEETDWIGGQLTAQGVCTPDENRWIETAGGTASYRAFRERTRERYRSEYRLSETAIGEQRLNIGSCWVSRMAVEPRVASDLLAASLAELPNVEVRIRTRVIEVENRINTIYEVIAQGPDGRVTRFLPTFVLDATELGDLLPLAGVEYVIGAESRAETGEPDAPERAHPEWVQPFTFTFALELRPEGEDHTILPPPDYEELKRLQRYRIIDGAMRGMFGEGSWWTYRRVIDASNFDDPAFPRDIAMINTGSNDFKGGIVPSGDQVADLKILAMARRASLGYVYWLQTECPRADDPSRLGYPELKLRGDLFGTEDGIAPQPYIRESRRIKAVKTVVEHEIIATDGAGQSRQAGPRAAFFPDSVGIGHYWLDIHDGGTDEPGRFLDTRPFQIPLGALIPVRVTNLIPACKNIGVTHLTNGAYRLHPIEWNVGEAAGALAAYCAANRFTPRGALDSPSTLRKFQRALLDAGVPLYWWADLSHDHPAFIPAQALAMEGIWPAGNGLEFLAADSVTEDLAVHLDAVAGRGSLPVAVGRPRGDIAREMYRSLFPNGWGA